MNSNVSIKAIYEKGYWRIYHANRMFIGSTPIAAYNNMEYWRARHEDSSEHA